MRPRRRPERKHIGFTLLEVLVALLVLALAMTALQLRMSQHLDSAAYLRDKTVAQWVALNQLTLLRLADRMGTPVQGAMDGRVEMAGRTWYWALTPLIGTGLDESAVIPLSIGVSELSVEAARGAPLVQMIGAGHAPE